MGEGPQAQVVDPQHGAARCDAEQKRRVNV